MRELEKMLDELNKIYESSRTVPIRIRVNEKWLQEQLDRELMLYEKAKLIGCLCGIPVVINNDIESFEFVYDDFGI